MTQPASAMPPPTPRPSFRLPQPTADSVTDLEQAFSHLLNPPDPVPGQTTAVLYLRVSTKKQAKKGGQKEGFSIPAQRTAALLKAQSLQAAVVAEFAERGESAKTADRHELQALLKYIAEHPVTYVIVHKLDRWARNREDDVDIAKLLRAAGVQLISCTEDIDDETPAGALFRGIMSSVNEYHNRNLALEVVKGTVQKVQLGGTPGNAPIGYLNVPEMVDGREIRTVLVDPVRGPLIRWAFDAYATGEWTIRTLLAELTAKGLVSKPGPERPSKPLTRSQLNRVLHHPYYKGLVSYMGATHVGTHEPLVDVETWNQVQTVLEAQNSAGEKRRTHHHYLKGSVFCGQCESRLIVSHAKNRHGTVYPYFVCIGRHQKRTDCTQQAMPIDWVEAKVEEHYAGLGFTAQRAEFLREYIRDGLSHRRADAELERRHQTKRIGELTDQRRKLLQAHYAGALPLDLLKEEQDRITRQLVAAESRLAAAEQTFVDIETTLEQALQLAQDCQVAYRLAGPRLRRLVNQAFFEKLLLDDHGTVHVELAEPFASLLGDELAAEAAAHLAGSDEAKRTATEGAAQNDEAATPWRGDGFWDRETPDSVGGLNMSRLVDLTGQLSNPRPVLCQLSDLGLGSSRHLSPEVADSTGQIPRAKSRTARPLKSTEVAELVASYQAGRTMKELAAKFGIDRRTVPTHLHRAGVETRRGGLDEEAALEAARLYKAGWSSGRLAKRFDVSADNVLKTLRRAGVAIRPRRGGPMSKDASA